MEQIKQFGPALTVFMLSVWVGGLVITFLPEGAVALHFAALATMLAGMAIGVWMFVAAMPKPDTNNRRW